MSAFLAIRYANAVRMLTDGSAYNAEGTFAGSLSKVWKAGRVPIALSGRGNWHMVHAVAAEICQHADRVCSVDETVEWIGRLLLQVREGAVGTVRPFDMVLCGWSESRGGIILAFGWGVCMGGYAPWQVHDMGGEALGGPDVSAAEVATFATVPHTHPDFLDRHGLELFELMRRKPAEINGGYPEKAPIGYVIGGQCDLTTVTAAGVTTKTLRRWEDKPGEKINPFSEHGNVTPIAHAAKPATRAERRQAKALARKARAA